jgi:hypothetical protein
MIEVYMDESGVHGGSPAVTSSAVWARPSVWKAWTRDWCLKKGPISVFHAQECHSRTGAFEGWSREDRDALVVGQLLPLVRKHKIFGRFSGLDLNTYRAQLVAHPDVLDWFGHPYIACFQWTLRSLCQAAVHHHQTAVAIIHEINDYKEGILWTVQYTQRKFPGLLLSVEFGSKVDFVPLQCADIVAYEVV